VYYHPLYVWNMTVVFRDLPIRIVRHWF